MWGWGGGGRGDQYSHETMWPAVLWVMSCPDPLGSLPPSSWSPGNAANQTTLHPSPRGHVRAAWLLSGSLEGHKIMPWFDFLVTSFMPFLYSLLLFPGITDFFLPCVAWSYSQGFSKLPIIHSFYQILPFFLEDHPLLVSMLLFNICSLELLWSCHLRTFLLYSADWRYCFLNSMLFYSLMLLDHTHKSFSKKWCLVFEKSIFCVCDCLKRFLFFSWLWWLRLT